MNQRLLIAVVLGAVFLAIFAATTVVLLTVTAPGQNTASREAPTWAERRLEQPTDRRASSSSAASEISVSPQPAPPGGRDRLYPRSGADGSGRAFGGPAVQQPVAQADDWWQDPAMRPRAAPGAIPMQEGATGNTGSYRFRPLDERERERLRRQGEIPLDWSGRADRDASESGFSAGDRLPDGSSSDWGATPYQFRPTDPPRTAPGPHGGRPEPHAPRGFGDPRLFAPIPQWGASPPDMLPGLPPGAPDLYPSLTPPSPSRLTIR